MTAAEMHQAHRDAITVSEVYAWKILRQALAVDVKKVPQPMRDHIVKYRAAQARIAETRTAIAEADAS